MATMKRTKPSTETIAYFERIAPGAPLETRQMFGMPCRFLNGHLLVGVFENTLMLHLSEADRAECILAGAKPFTPMGREMMEFVDISPGTFDDREMKEWIVRGMRYIGSLEPKLPRMKKTVRSPILPGVKTPILTKAEANAETPLMTPAVKTITLKPTGMTQAMRAVKAVKAVSATKTPLMTRALTATGASKAVKRPKARKGGKAAEARRATQDRKSVRAGAKRAKAKPAALKRAKAQPRTAKRVAAKVARAAKARIEQRTPTKRSKAKPGRRIRRK